MPGASRPDDAFAIQDNEQYQAAETGGDQHVRVIDGAGAGLLLCNASHSLGIPHSSIERLLIVVHGALRDSGRYLGLAEAATGRYGARTLIVAPQFLADVDTGARADAQKARCTGTSRAGRAVSPLSGPRHSARSLRWTACCCS